MATAIHKNDAGQLQRVAAEAHECGDVLVIGTRLAIVSGLKAVVAGDSMTLDTSGLKNLPAKTSDAWDDGAELYWDEADQQLTDTAGSNPKAGLADGNKLTGEMRAACDINARA